MDRIGVVLVDDEPPARDKLRTFLAEDPRVDVLGEAGDGMKAVAMIEELRPELVFLDIQMPEMDGFEVLEALDVDPLPQVVFVTAYDEHAVRAFEVRALDYLLKPVDADRFEAAVDRAIEELARGRSAEAGARARDVLSALPRERRVLERFLVRKRGRMFLVPVERVDWIAAAGNYVELHAGSESHLVRGTLQELDERLDPALFARIHRSTIVNLRRVKELHPWSHGDLLVVLADGTELRMSRRYRDALHGTFGQ